MAGSFFEFRERIIAQNSAKAPAAPVKPASLTPLTVTQLTAIIDRAIKAGVESEVHVKGELSNYHHHGASGNAYFTLKDDKSCINCVMWRSELARLKFTPQDGIELLASGRIGVYGAKGQYQLYANSLQPVGQGALELALRQLRAKLYAEGLFAPERKKPLPRYPTRIAIVTSRDTAALQDVLKVLTRFPWLKLVLCHVPVQGDGAGGKIAAMLRRLGRMPDRLDAILLARGGGSLEDLWEFNEEVVARAVAASRVPVVTGIGHEIDTSIADLVADHFAHTPTEAAQVLTQYWKNASAQLEQASLRLSRDLRDKLRDLRQQLHAIECRETFRRPQQRIHQLQQRLDDRERSLQLAMTNHLRGLHRKVQQAATRLDGHRPDAILARLRERLRLTERRLSRAAGSRIHRAHVRLLKLSAALKEKHPRHQVRLSQIRLAYVSDCLERKMLAGLRRRTKEVKGLSAHLNAVGPEQVLKRGYSITTRKKDGAVIRNASQVKEGDRLITRLADGQIESTAEDGRQLPLFE